MVHDQGVRHPEQTLFGLVGVSNESLTKVCRRARHIRKALGEEATCAALCEGQDGAPLLEQASDRSFQGLVVLADVVVAEARDHLLLDRRYLFLRLLLGGGPGGDTQAHPALASQWGDRGVGGVEEILDFLSNRGLTDAGEVEGLGDDGAFAAGPEQGLERRLEHALHLRWHSWKCGEQRPFPLHERPHGRPHWVGDELASLGEEGLFVVVAVGLRPNFVNILSTCSLASGYSTISRPVRVERQALVRSSEVGPRPPVVATRSELEAAWRRAATILSELSPTVV